jgi:hypothetical protein
MTTSSAIPRVDDDADTREYLAGWLVERVRGRCGRG